MYVYQEHWAAFEHARNAAYKIDLHFQNIKRHPLLACFSIRVVAWPMNPDIELNNVHARLTTNLLPRNPCLDVLFSFQFRSWKLHRCIWCIDYTGYVGY
jgi:hypothetical protein